VFHELEVKNFDGKHMLGVRATIPVVLLEVER